MLQYLYREFKRFGADAVRDRAQRVNSVTGAAEVVTYELDATTLDLLTRVVVVLRIFTDYVSGVTPRDIAAALNRVGIPPPRGRRWNASTINGNTTRGHGIIINDLYAGRIVWNKVRMVKNPDTGRSISRPNPPSEWQSVEAPHLRIVDEAMFVAARAVKGRQGACADASKAATSTPALGITALWALRRRHISPRSRPPWPRSRPLQRHDGEWHMQ